MRGVGRNEGKGRLIWGMAFIWVIVFENNEMNLNGECIGELS